MLHSSSAQTPQLGDIILTSTNDASGRHSLRIAGEGPQIAYQSYEESIDRADRFARLQHVDVWKTDDDRVFMRIREYRVGTPGLTTDDMLRRVRGEFLEMPGLRITEAQARRLWGLDVATCSALLNTLIDAGFLFRTRNGAFMRLDHGTQLKVGVPSRTKEITAA